MIMYLLSGAHNMYIFSQWQKSLLQNNHVDLHANFNGAALVLFSNWYILSISTEISFR